VSKVIIHIDLNAFFASVEEIKNPKLVGKPHAVGGSIKRGVLSTCSYAARKRGLHSAMPVAQALKLCPELIINPSDFKSYREYSNKFFEIIRNWCGDKIEIASIDECYVDFSDYNKYCDEPTKYLKELQGYIKATLNLGCSIGVAPNKFLAKMASDMKKPMGFTVLRKRDVEKILWPLDVGDMYGIGKKTAPRLKEIGIMTIGDLAKSENNYAVKNLLGKGFYTFINWANGNDNSEVIDYEVDAKSIGNSTTYDHDLMDESEIKFELKELSRVVSRRICAVSSLAFGISITIKFNDFTHINRSTKLDSPICNDDEVYLKALRLFETNYYYDKPIRLLGVTLYDIKDKSEVIKQLNIFDVEINKETTNDIINKLNELMGDRIFKKASEVKKDD
jgi:DNA polymerase-4